MRVAAVADAPSQTPREDSILLAAQSYSTERENSKKKLELIRWDAHKQMF